jgi:hypothetical protein
MSDTHDDGPPPWDSSDAQALIGSRVLIGLSYCSASGLETHREQLHGVVLSADQHDGVEVRLHGAHQGEVRRFPPDPGAFEVANPGVYRLRTTGEEVIDPDYLATWTITEPD